jgi:hypothetical protein
VAEVVVAITATTVEYPEAEPAGIAVGNEAAVFVHVEA